MTHWRLLLQNDFLVIVLMLTLRRDLEVNKRDNVVSDGDPGQLKRVMLVRIDTWCARYYTEPEIRAYFRGMLKKNAVILIKYFNLLFFNAAPLSIICLLSGDFFTSEIEGN